MTVIIIATLMSLTKEEWYDKIADTVMNGKERNKKKPERSESDVDQKPGPVGLNSSKSSESTSSSTAKRSAEEEVSNPVKKVGGSIISAKRILL